MSSENIESLKKKWSKSRNAYIYLTDYIAQKNNRYLLDEFDIVLVSNFKGGFASIQEPKTQLLAKLIIYSQILMEIWEKYKDKRLQDIHCDKVNELGCSALNFLNLTAKSNESNIDGFGASYASALLNVYFPKLLPIIDRRVLNGSEIEVNLTSNNQVVNIKSYYKEYLLYCYKKLKNSDGKLEELDLELFSKPLKYNLKNKLFNKPSSS